MSLRLVLILLLLAGTSYGQQSFTKVAGTTFEQSDFEFSSSSYKYVLASDGRGRREGGNGPVRRFDLRLHKNDYLTRDLYYAEYEGDLLLVCEYSDSEYGAGFIARLDGATLAMKWKRGTPAFNVGPALMEDKFAYVTAIGFVAKVNLETGAFAWKHDNLYRTIPKKKGQPYADADFNSFELPEVKGDIVYFKEVETSRLPPKTHSVQKRTGKIVSIK
jgi:hypothetical protein